MATRGADRRALERALEICRQESPERARQLDAMLATRPRFEVERFAAYCCQTNSLQLRPWQSPPCCVEVGQTDDDGLGDIGGRRVASQLLERMLSLGISRWHPSPLEAIREAERVAGNGPPAVA